MGGKDLARLHGGQELWLVRVDFSESQTLDSTFREKIVYFSQEYMGTPEFNV